MKKLILLLTLGFILCLSNTADAGTNTLRGDVTITEDCTIAGTLSVNGDVQLLNDVTITGNLSIAGTLLNDELVRIVLSQTSVVRTGTTTIPSDDTIPQKTEGDQYMVATIIPKSVANILKIEVHMYGSLSGGGQVVMALFQDTTASALTAVSTQDAAAFNTSSNLVYWMVAGTTSSTTFKVRIGPSAGTYTFGGVGGVRRWGAIPKNSITITEYTPNSVTIATD